MARLNLTRSLAADGGECRTGKEGRPYRRMFGIGLAIVSLACAACGHSGSTPSPTASATATATSSSSPSAIGSPCAAGIGEAYVPDNGNGRGFNGVQVAHFQDVSDYLCGTAPKLPSVTNFQASVGGLAFAPDTGSGLSVALALLAGPSGYQYAQDVFQADIGQIVPIGAAYNLAVQPTPVPSTTPNPNVTAATITDASSVAIIGSFTQAVALITGPNAQAIVALTSLNDAPPQYGSSVPYAGTNYTLKPGIPADNYSIVRASENGEVVLIRGVNHLVSFGVTEVATGYQFDAKAQDPNLGFGSPVLRGLGAIAMDSADSSRALVGKGNVVTLVTGLPDAINETAHVIVPGTTIRAIRVAGSGFIAAVATDVGVSILTGVNGQTPVLAPAFTTSKTFGANQLPYINCEGQPSVMSNVYSVGFSAGDVPGTSNDYLLAFGTSVPPPPVNGSCTYPASIVAIPINPATGTTPSPTPTATATSSASPIPKQFTQNNVIAPPTGVDDFFVH